MWANLIFASAFNKKGSIFGLIAGGTVNSLSASKYLRISGTYVSTLLNLVLFKTFL